MIYLVYALISVIFIVLAYETGVSQGWDEGWEDCDDWWHDKTSDNVIVVKKRD